MYRLTCDGFPLLDWRDNDLTLVNPKLNLEVNTVGEGSFTIYKSHPYYDKIQKLKSVFEVSDDTGVIFRGRATGDSRDFDHGMAVDLEGAMAFFNDSVVRPFSFPKDFLEDDGYLAAERSGNVVEYFLSWLIDKHNAQVQDFQKMKLGNVTVTDPANAIIRSSSNYVSTWDALKSKLIDSALGGYLCIRYEEDGNYIDYLSEFTETNSQRIEYGENLLDLKNETEALTTYSAVIPIGAAEITIEGQPDKDLTDDLVKSGDTIYSRKAVAAYGWIYAPTSETTWDDVVDDADLVKTAAEWLANEGIFQLSSIEAAAVDLHFTDEQAESLRIYKNVEVHSKPHGVTETFPLDRLEIDLLNPQNTRITVGKTLASLTERTSIQQDEAIQRYSKLSKTDEEIRLYVANEIEGVNSTISATADAINLEIHGEDGNGGLEGRVAALSLSLDSIKLEVRGEDGESGLAGRVSSIETTLENITLEVSNGDTSSTIRLLSDGVEIDSAKIEFTGVVTFNALNKSPDIGQTTIDGGWLKGEILEGNTIAGGVFTDPQKEYFLEMNAEDGLYGMRLRQTSIPGNFTSAIMVDLFTVYWDGLGTIALGGTGNDFLGVTSDELSTLVKPYGVWNFSYADSVNFGGASADDLGITFDVPEPDLSDISISSIGAGTAWLSVENVPPYGYCVVSNRSIIPYSDDWDEATKLNMDYLGLATYPWAGLYADSCSACTSDENKKNSIEDLPEKYLVMFDNIHPKRFKMNNGTSNRYHAGYTTQDVRTAMDIAGIDSTEFGGWIKDTDKDGNDIYMLRYEEFGAIYAAKIKQLEARVARLEEA